jgi:hypothetical protein
MGREDTPVRFGGESGSARGCHADPAARTGAGPGHAATPGLTRPTYSAGSPRHSFKCLSSVHPQTPSQEAKEEFGPTADPAVAERIGNLVLVEKSINASSLGNRPFSEKRLVYPQSQLLLARTVAERPKVGAKTKIDAAVANLDPFDTWNEEAVERRQEMPLSLAYAEDSENSRPFRPDVFYARRSIHAGGGAGSVAAAIRFITDSSCSRLMQAAESRAKRRWMRS